MTTTRFNCDCCGLCCRNIGGIPQLSQFDRGDGVCSHLTADNLCDIYESRPEVCSVEQMYSRFSSQMTKSEYLEMMERSCEFLKAHHEQLQTGNLSLAEFDDLTSTIPTESFLDLASEVGVNAITD